MKIASIGIDLGKTTFHLVALDEHGKAVIRKKSSRTQVLAFTANLPPSLIGTEASSGAHFIGRALRAQGRDVRLIPRRVSCGRFDRLPNEHESAYIFSSAALITKDTEKRSIAPSLRDSSPNGTLSEASATRARRFLTSTRDTASVALP